MIVVAEQWKQDYSCGICSTSAVVCGCLNCLPAALPWCDPVLHISCVISVFLFKCAPILWVTGRCQILGQREKQDFVNRSLGSCLGDRHRCPGRGLKITPQCWFSIGFIRFYFMFLSKVRPASGRPAHLRAAPGRPDPGWSFYGKAGFDMKKQDSFYEKAGFC